MSKVPRRPDNFGLSADGQRTVQRTCEEFDLPAVIYIISIFLTIF